MYKSPKTLAFTALTGIVYSFVFPQFALSSVMTDFMQSDQMRAAEEYKVEMTDPEGLSTFQGNALIQSSSPDTPMVIRTQWVLTTAYSSTVDQTDSTPFITANGTRVRDGIVACNFLRFGTRVRFPQHYGDKVFVVTDRMALKNSHKIDIWMTTREEAIQFGARTLKVEVLLN